MAEKFFLFRFSMLLRSQKDLFVEGSDPSRESYLREVLGSEISFTHRSNLFIYVPDQGGSGKTYLLGRIGREVRTEENLPPESGLAESFHDGWRAAAIVIDPTHHSDGQKVALEFNRQVGDPSSLILAFVSEINLKYSYLAYELFVEPISDAKTFWNFASENKGRITSLTFEFVAPNMFGTATSIDEEMKNLQDNEKVQKLSMNLFSKDGLETDTERIRESVEYIARGAGEIKARAGNRLFSSKHKTQIVTINDIDKNKSFLNRVASKVEEILGR